MANTPIEEKMKMISDMLDVMPDNIDMDLVCNTLAAIIVAYSFEDQLDKVFVGTAFCVAENVEANRDRVVH
jgi:hypothetical protein